MAKELHTRALGESVGEDQTNRPVSRPYKPSDRMQALVTILLEDVTVANGITLKLRDSYDGGGSYQDVGSESEVAVVKHSFGDEDVSTENGTIAVAGHGFEADEPILFKGAGLPDGLVAGTPYYAVLSGDDAIKVAAVPGGTPLELESVGEGDVYRLRYQIRMISQDSNDLEQLPLNDHVIVAATTGAGDSLTVKHVYVPE